MSVYKIFGKGSTIHKEEYRLKESVQSGEEGTSYARVPTCVTDPSQTPWSPYFGTSFSSHSDEVT